MVYLVAFDSKTWHVDPEVLRAALRQEWPATVMQSATPHIESDVRDVHWQYAADGDVLDAYTHKDGACLYLDGGISLVAKFAVWYRKLVPADIDVIFCNDSYSFDCVVTPDSTESDLIELAD